MRMRRGWQSLRQVHPSAPLVVAAIENAEVLSAQAAELFAAQSDKLAAQLVAFAVRPL